MRKIRILLIAALALAVLLRAGLSMLYPEKHVDESQYLEEVALPQVEAGIKASGREREDFEIWGGGFIATGATDEEVAKEMDWVRYRLAFYGSTRSYHGVLACHDELDLGMKLHAMSKRGAPFWRSRGRRSCGADRLPGTCRPGAARSRRPRCGHPPGSRRSHRRGSGRTCRAGAPPPVRRSPGAYRYRGAPRRAAGGGRGCTARCRSRAR